MNDLIRSNDSNALQSVDTISRQAAVDAPEEFIKDCNPEHFVGHQKFIEYMDNAEIGSFGQWQFANGFNMGLTAAEVAIKKLPSAQEQAENAYAHGYTDAKMDYQPKQGKWESCGTDSFGDVSVETDRCTNCGELVNKQFCVYGYRIKMIYKYCPNCGARMEGSEE